MCAIPVETAEAVEALAVSLEVRASQGCGGGSLAAPFAAVPHGDGLVLLLLGSNGGAMLLVLFLLGGGSGSRVALLLLESLP